MNELQQALQILEIIVKKKTPYQNGEETEIAYKALEIIKAKCLEADKPIEEPK